MLKTYHRSGKLDDEQRGLTKMKLLHAMVVGVAIFAEPVGAVPTQVLLPGSIWEYTFVDPTYDPSWNIVTGGWRTGAAPFGNNTKYDFAYNTYWPRDRARIRHDGDLWVRTTVDFSGFDLSAAWWELGVDNGFKLYVNGELVRAGRRGGYTYRWEYAGGFGSALREGPNVIAVALDDYGGLTAFDMRITAGPASVASASLPLALPVPLPGTAWLALGAMAALGGMMRIGSARRRPLSGGATT